MAKIYPTLICVLLSFPCFAQGSHTDSLKRDTTRHLSGVTVRGYLTEQPVLGVPASVSVISAAQLKLQPGNSLVPALNTVPGVRMEERSPGSYRLSIRGSLLRSPFGVRDVKIYYDELPLTDAGGNTYLNAIDPNSVQGIEVLKGPDGSLFGANSGGVVLLNPVNRYNDSSYLAAGLGGGSYGLVRQNASLQNHSANNQLNISEAYQTAAGYRQNSNMDRTYLQVFDKVSFSQKDQLKLIGLYSALNYETPGGLTLSQFQADPQLARLATKTIPGSIQQHAGIKQKMLFGGAVNEWHLSERIRNVTSVFGTYVDFANPFITTYNQRYEGTYGLRSYFEWSGKPDTAINWKVNLGVEWQQTNSDINSYGNRGGVRDTAQALDKIHTNQHFIFARYLADFSRKLHLEAALSLNFYGYEFRNVFPNNEASFTNRTFTPQLMPRIALSYQVTNNFIWRASVSRGYSTPTTTEIRPTDQVVNNSLKAEDGWNYETGFRLRNDDESMYLDASVFYYDLHNAIVPQQNADGTAYYVNAGDTHQPGFEVYFSDWLIRRNSSNFIRGLQFNISVTLDKFTFANYNENGVNYSGNKLTGVPEQVVVSSLQARLPAGLYLFAQYNYTSKLPLNDANSAFAGAYHLVQLKGGWETRLGKTRVDFYAGADNLLNQKYSLGNDLNAVGNRYYNAAAPRNYYAGMNVMF
ncbi:TonB-dependent receptor [Mucilaginibacter sp.]|jgi:iron complex outermembrane receptor protein|uniref:TonB-dependent receptor n=1 Tax=Mucilaginibacter sp. TaxID=1882438 RepID=UPI002D01F390|nr:TonB-dependent receptor [Mucilaginibacter sp.]HTI61228.1 TonB-dependent receptor [Mucilaginibacter sp.]